MLYRFCPFSLIFFLEHACCVAWIHQRGGVSRIGYISDTNTPPIRTLRVSNFCSNSEISVRGPIHVVPIGYGPAQQQARMPLILPPTPRPQPLQAQTTRRLLRVCAQACQCQRETQLCSPAVDGRAAAQVTLSIHRVGEPAASPPQPQPAPARLQHAESKRTIQQRCW